MIAITEYDATTKSNAQIICDGANQPIGVTRGREPVATIHLTVVASGADLDKFLRMLETITGQTYHADTRAAPALPR